MLCAEKNAWKTPRGGVFHAFFSAHNIFGGKCFQKKTFSLQFSMQICVEKYPRPILILNGEWGSLDPYI